MTFDCEHRASDPMFRLPANERARKEKQPVTRKTVLTDHAETTPGLFARTDIEHFEFLKNLNRRMREFWGQR
jgi:hypothetical protein